MASPPDHAGSTPMTQGANLYCPSCRFLCAAFLTRPNGMNCRSEASGNSPVTRTLKKSLSAPYASSHWPIFSLSENLTDLEST